MSSVHSLCSLSSIGHNGFENQSVRFTNMLVKIMAYLDKTAVTGILQKSKIAQIIVKCMSVSHSGYIITEHNLSVFSEAYKAAVRLWLSAQLPGMPIFSYTSCVEIPDVS